MTWHVEIMCVCDGCGRIEMAHSFGNKTAAWEYVAKDGWRKIDGQHLCFECAYQKTGRWTAPWERSEDDVIDSRPVDWSQFEIHGRA